MVNDVQKSPLLPLAPVKAGGRGGFLMKRKRNQKDGVVGKTEAQPQLNREN